jgi:hypothetical protein
MVSDLKYNKVWAGAESNDVENPVASIQRVAGKKVTKVLSTNEKANSTNISWNFIDLTKSSDNWFDSKDGYSLFSFDKTKGYWVYLQDATMPFVESDGSSEFDASSISVTTIYDHDFVNDMNSSTSPYNYTTTNTIRQLSITVDASNITTSVDRAVATLNGQEYTLTKSGNQYSVDVYGLNTLGTGSVADLNVTFFTSDNLFKTVGVQLDNSAPTRPKITRTDGISLNSVTISSLNSNDTKYFYLYSGDINGSSPASGGTLVEANITATNGSASNYNLCAKATSFSTNLGAYRVIAIDSNSSQYPGQIDYNLVSDIGYLNENNFSATIYPIYKNASILSVSTEDESDTNSTDYEANCSKSGQSATDHAVELIGEVSGTVTIAFEANVSEFASMAPSALKDVNLSVDGTTVAKIKFDGDHYKNSGQKFLLYYPE